MPASATILIVDDTPAGQETLEQLLFAQGYELAFASNGYEALAKAAELRPDLILLDVMMPGMDGFEVCRRLRADPRLAEAPVVMITTLDDRESRLQGIEAGADDFISKPFDRAELRLRVRTITRLNRYRGLLAERLRFEWVVEQANEGYLLTDGADRLLYANPQARLYLDLAPEPAELPATTFYSQTQKQYRCEPAEAWAGWPAPPDFPELTPLYLVRPESATARAFWLQATVLDRPAGLENQRLIHLRDVTAQMNLRRNMRTFQDALSHKLRTPLTHISAGLELLLETTEAQGVEEWVNLVKVAVKGAGRLRRELEDILQYLDVPKTVRTSAGCSLAELNQVATELGQELGLAALTISDQEGLADKPLALSRPAVECILWEILENAKKFHPQQSPMVEITLAKSGPDSLSLKFADDGLTLSPEQLAQVWTPYYQGEKYFTGEAIGMGLGLPTVASLIWEVGGSCRLYNRPAGPGVVVELIAPLLTMNNE
jgi:DNA-binding response OmpR family regulator